MNDLVHSFFERDLAPDESRELGRILESSEEEAMRFAALGEAAYLALGLPAHQWPGGTRWPFHPGSAAGPGHSLFALVLAALGLGGLAAWWLWPKTDLKTLAPAPAVEIAAPVPVSKPASVRLESAPAVKPLPALPGPEGKRLNVLVDLPRMSLVTVRVMDPQGVEVRHLYTGFLKPGRWSFTWDGLLSGGKSAPPGSYSIQVRSDLGTMVKNVELSVQP